MSQIIQIIQIIQIMQIIQICNMSALNDVGHEAGNIYLICPACKVLGHRLGYGLQG